MSLQETTKSDAGIMLKFKKDSGSELYPEWIMEPTDRENKNVRGHQDHGHRRRSWLSCHRL